jgi:hypothetical protein
MEYHGMMALFFIGFLYEQTSIKTHKETSQKKQPRIDLHNSPAAD